MDASHSSLMSPSLRCVLHHPVRGRREGRLHERRRAGTALKLVAVHHIAQLGGQNLRLAPMESPWGRRFTPGNRRG